MFLRTFADTKKLEEEDFDSPQVSNPHRSTEFLSVYPVSTRHAPFAEEARYSSFKLWLILKQHDLPSPTSKVVK
ncbi:hypothetical protein EAF04_003592 [Stromatinia cepivora]|nr:hypothetical protein EAF04_003592 [Stromatinia cepivora]